MPTSSFWRDESKVTQLRELWEAGYSGSACAALLGCSRAAAIAKAGRIGCGPHTVRVHNKRPKTARSKPGRRFAFRPKAPAKPRLKVVRTKPAPDFSWHLAMVAQQGEARQIKPPPGLLSWRTFTRTAESDPALRARLDAAIQARRDAGTFRRKKAA